MGTAEHNKDRASQHQATKHTAVRPAAGDDHQLPGIGYRRDRPALPSAQELPAQEQHMSERGQANFLLTGLGTLVPLAAFTVPTFRRQLLGALRGDSPAPRLTGVLEQGGTIASDFAARPPGGRVRGRYRLGLLPSLLLGTLLGGGATLFYLSRKNAESQDVPQQFSSPQQPQPGDTSQQTSAPTISGAAKDAAITMVNQAQEILSEARSAIGGQAAPAIAERIDEQQTALPSVANVEAQPTGNLGESTPIQAMPTAEPINTTEQIHSTPAVTPATNEQLPEAAPASSPSSPPSAAAVSAAAPQQQSVVIAPPTASAAKSVEKVGAEIPQAIAGATNAAAAATAELQARIRERMPVLDSKGMRVGAVDRVEAGGSIKLAKDGQGKSHWLPLRWVTRVDTHVHLVRTAQQVRREWKASAPRAH